MNYRTLTMPEILAEAEAIAVDAVTLFGRLNAAQLNWKPGPDRWSVAQCLDHLINANREMRGPLDQIIAGTKKTRWLERVPGLAGLMGGLMVKSLDPASTRKLKAPRSITPSASTIAPDIVQRFTASQRETIGRLRSVAAHDPAHVIMTSPLAGFVVYSALDGCRIIVVHERRHFGQAQRVMAAPGFPSE